MRVAAATALGLSLVFVGAGSGAGPSSQTGRPTLKLMRPSPLQVKATGFHAAERVRVVAVVDRRITKRVSASALGAFTLRFPGVSVDRCSGFAIFAVGARGSRASLTRPHVYCPPPL